MKKRTRSTRIKTHKPAGHKLWRAVLRRMYGKAWREHVT